MPVRNPKQAHRRAARRASADAAASGGGAAALATATPQQRPAQATAPAKKKRAAKAAAAAPRSSTYGSNSSSSTRTSSSSADDDEEAAAPARRLREAMRGGRDPSPAELAAFMAPAPRLEALTSKKADDELEAAVQQLKAAGVRARATGNFREFNALRDKALAMVDARMKALDEEEAAEMRRRKATRAMLSKERVANQHEMAQVLIEAVMHGKSPEGCWHEIMVLTRSSTINEAKTIAGQTIGFSLVWKTCEISAWPNIMQDLCDGKFDIADLAVEAHRGIGFRLEVVDAITGEMTSRGDRIYAKPGFSFGGAVENAIARCTVRRQKEEASHLALFQAIAERERARRAGQLQRGELVLPSMPAELVHTLGADTVAMLARKPEEVC